MFRRETRELQVLQSIFGCSLGHASIGGFLGGVDAQPETEMCDYCIISERQGFSADTTTCVCKQPLGDDVSSSHRLCGKLQWTTQGKQTVLA